MGWKPIHFAFAGMMLVFGSFNTLSVKWADTMSSKASNGEIQPFRHPFLQACGMFLGEMLCMLAFWIVRWRASRAPQSAYPPVDDSNAPRKFNPLIFLPPALCDMTATSCQYIGLTLTYASSFQMLRGAVIIFTGILSTIFLKRKLGWFRWLGMLLVTGGLVTVGVSDMIYTQDKTGNNSTGHNSTGVGLTQDWDKPAGFWSVPTFVHKLYGNDTPHANSDIILGDLLIVCSQVIVATQMVIEERFVSKYNVPALQAVGWEGAFGFTTLALLLIPFRFIYVGDKFGKNPHHVLEDAYDGLYQLAHNPLLAIAFSGTVISIAFFNFAGISVTKELSATTRMVLDSIRTIVIWGFSMIIGWQKFFALQLLGFVILITGMCVYNDIIIVPFIKWISLKLGCCAVSNTYEDLEEQESDTEETNENEENVPVFDPSSSPTSPGEDKS